MPTRHALNVIGLLAILAVLLTAAVQVQALHEQVYPQPVIGDDTLYLTSGRALRHMTVSLNALAADVYWIRALQYYGGTKRRLAQERFVPPPPAAIVASSDYDQLYPMLDVTTSLDPRFKIAYRFGAVFLAEAFPSGAGRPDLAVQLLEKGLREEPDKWQYMEDIGFVHYWYDHDYRAAAAAFQKASEMTEAPWWLRSLAATTLAEGGDRSSSRTMWTAIRESAEIDWLRSDAERRLSQLDALDQIDELQRIVDRYTKPTGQPPADWRAVARAGLTRGVPLDPARTHYELTADGRVRLAESSRLWPLPVEPERLDKKPPS
jgi:hypothetical protein